MINHQNKKYIRTSIPWLLSAVVVGLAFFVWGSSFDWQFAGFSAYQLFPIFGLLAFSIMWSQYMAGFMNKTLLKSSSLGSYFNWTGYLVLALILLHPGLLAYQRLRDGFGLPPASETSYVAPSLAWVVVLGMVSLLVFLSFELHHWLDKYSWWQYTGYLVDAAMLAIFYHALELGTQTHVTWYRAVWWFYGISLICILIYNYTQKLVKRRGSNY